MAEMKAAAASREIVKNIDIKNKLRCPSLYKLVVLINNCVNVKTVFRKLSNGSENNYVPPKQLLLYLVR